MSKGTGSAISSKNKSNKQSRGTWTVQEDESLTKAVELYGAKNWKKIAESVPGRSDVQCLHRWQKVLNPELVKGPWTEEEDQKVRDLVRIHGAKKWSVIASHLPGRIGKQCRERWTNHLDPGVKKGNWEPWEDDMIVKLQREMGNKWARIAKSLPGRTDNAVKNRFNSTISRRIRQSKPAGGNKAQRNIKLPIRKKRTNDAPEVSLSCKPKKSDIETSIVDNEPPLESQCGGSANSRRRTTNAQRQAALRRRRSPSDGRKGKRASNPAGSDEEDDEDEDMDVDEEESDYEVDPEGGKGEGEEYDSESEPAENEDPYDESEEPQSLPVELQPLPILPPMQTRQSLHSQIQLSQHYHLPSHVQNIPSMPPALIPSSSVPSSMISPLLNASDLPGLSFPSQSHIQSQSVQQMLPELQQQGPFLQPLHPPPIVNVKTCDPLLQALSSHVMQDHIELKLKTSPGDGHISFPPITVDIKTDPTLLEVKHDIKEQPPEMEDVGNSQSPLRSIRPVEMNRDEDHCQGEHNSNQNITDNDNVDSLYSYPLSPGPDITCRQNAMTPIKDKVDFGGDLSFGDLFSPPPGTPSSFIFSPGLPSSFSPSVANSAFTPTKLKSPPSILKKRKSPSPFLSPTPKKHRPSLWGSPCGLSPSVFLASPLGRPSFYGVCRKLNLDTPDSVSRKSGCRKLSDPVFSSPQKKVRRQLKLDDSFDDIANLLPGDMSSDILNTSLPDIVKEIPSDDLPPDPPPKDSEYTPNSPVDDQDSPPDHIEPSIELTCDIPAEQQLPHHSRSVKLLSYSHKNSKRQNHQSPTKSPVAQPKSLEDITNVGFFGGFNSFKLGDVKISQHLRQINQKINAASALAPPTGGPPNPASATVDEDGFVAPLGGSIPLSDKGLMTLQYLQFNEQKTSDLRRRAKRLLPPVSCHSTSTLEDVQSDDGYSVGYRDSDGGLEKSIESPYHDSLRKSFEVKNKETLGALNFDAITT